MIILARNWWTLVLRGVIGILFGVMAVFLPGMALLTLIYTYGIYAMADGVFNIASAFSKKEPTSHRRPWVLFLQGLVGVVAGGLAFFVPGLTALALLYIIAGWALATGVLEIAAAISLRKEIEGEWLLALGGVLSIGFGILLAAFPATGALAVVLWIGAYAIVLGALTIALGIKLRRWIKDAGVGTGFPAHA